MSQQQQLDNEDPLPESIDQEIDALMGIEPKKKKKKSNPRREPGYWQKHLMEHGGTGLPGLNGSIARVVRKIGKVLFFPVIGVGPTQRYDIDGNPLQEKPPLSTRLFYGLATRLMLSPLIFLGFIMFLVYCTTHPRHALALWTPESRGLFYQAVALPDADNQAMRGWYLPPLSVEHVLTDGEHALTRKWPGAILIHDANAANDQLLDLASALHNAGYAVLLLDPRGQGQSDPAAVTFGLRERFDALAAVRYLKNYPDVDGTRIALVGRGMGANTVLHAAALDQGINAVVAEFPWGPLDRQSYEAFTAAKLPGPFFSMAYRLTFEMMLREHLADLDLARIGRNIHQPTLLLSPAEENAVGSQLAALSVAGVIQGPHITIAGPDGSEPTAQVVNFLSSALHWDARDPMITKAVERLQHAQIH